MCSGPGPQEDGQHFALIPGLGHHRLTRLSVAGLQSYFSTLPDTRRVAMDKLADVVFS